MSCDGGIRKERREKGGRKERKGRQEERRWGEGEECCLLEASLMMQLVGLSRHVVGKPQTYTLTESSTDPELSLWP